MVVIISKLFKKVSNCKNSDWHKKQLCKQKCNLFVNKLIKNVSCGLINSTGQRSVKFNDSNVENIKQ